MTWASAGRGLVSAAILETSSDEEMEVVRRCTLCGSAEAEILFTTRDRKHGLPGLFAFLRCDECGMGRLSPRPRGDMLDRYYPTDGYNAYRQPTKDRQTGRRVDVQGALWSAELNSLGYDVRRHRIASFCRTLLPRELWRRSTYGWEGIPGHVPGGRALDVGCGNGEFLHLLKAAGWHVTGVDASETAARVARRSFGVEVHTTQLRDAPLARGTFDFVHMSHVIEHVHDPMELLQDAARLLRPGGQLYIETPNVESFSLRHWRSHWLHVDSPRHLWMFSHATLVRALRAAGFRVDRLYGRGGFRYYRWEWTFQREEREGHQLSRRPTVEPRAVPRLLALAACGSLAARADPTSGEVICCWARLDGPGTRSGFDDR